jgi:hypothetical protein
MGRLLSHGYYKTLAEIPQPVGFVYGANLGPPPAAPDPPPAAARKKATPRRRRGKGRRA